MEPLSAAGAVAAMTAENCRESTDIFNHAESCPHSTDCGVAPAAPIREKEQAMKRTSRVLDLTRNAGLVLLLAGSPLAACAGSTGDSGLLDQATGDLKGGVPASGKGKGKDKGEAGASGASASADDDAGVDEGPGNGNGKDKTKKPKKDKTHGANAGASGGDAEEAADESADEDVDESGDESDDQDGTADESADSDEDAADESV
jgi:hypothetical protein